MIVLDTASSASIAGGMQRMCVTDLVVDDLVLVAARVYRRSASAREPASSGWFEIDTIGRLYPRPL